MPREMVICADKLSEDAHKALFSWPDECYFHGAGKMLDIISALAKKDLEKLHIAAGFEAILKLALWTEDPQRNDIEGLLLRTGCGDYEHPSTGRPGVEEIFSRLYHRGRFDVLKRICRAAMLNAQSRTGLEKTSLHCHLVSADAQKIVASSL